MGFWLLIYDSVQLGATKLKFHHGLWYIMVDMLTCLLLAFINQLITGGSPHCMLHGAGICTLYD